MKRILTTMLIVLCCGGLTTWRVDGQGLASGSAGLPTAGSGGATAGDALASGTEQAWVWVTMGEDVFGWLSRDPARLSSLEPPRAFESNAGVVITRLLQRDLLTVSQLVHASTQRCSGYIVHSSYDEALEALDAASRSSLLPLPESFQIDQQTLVNQLLPQVTASNILGTIQHLSTTYNNRYYLNTSGEQAALWIRDLWQGYATGRSDVSVTTYSHSGYVQPSVILTIDGATLPSEVVVLGGHLDSIKSGATNTDPATIAPGADDNASGIAALSEAIRVLLDNGFVPDRTIKVMGYAAEEVGLRGSGDIAADFAAAGTNVIGVMQLDMTDYNGSIQDIVLMDDYTNAALNTFIGSLVDTYQPTLQWTYSTCGYGCSDHASWHNRGYAATMPFEAKFGEHNQAIHSSNDTLQTLGNSAAHAVKFSKLALSFAVESAMAECTPVVVADAGPDQQINEGGSVQIGTAALPNHTYSWSPGGATSAQITVSPTSTTVYTLSATTSCGTLQDSVTVTVIPAGSNGPQTATYNAGLGAPSCAIAGSSCDSLALLDGRAGLGPEPNQPNTLDSCTDGASGTYHSDESNDRIVVSTLDGNDFSEGATVEVAATVWAWSTGASDTVDLYYAADANSPTWVYITSLSPSAGGAQTLSAQYTLPAGSLQAVRANFRYNGTASSCASGSYDDTDDLAFAVGSAGPECTIDAECDDGLFCNGAETCNAGSCQTGGDPCPGLSCNETSDVCESTQPVVVTFTSIASEDGWIRELSETSGTGGTISSAGTGTRALRAGDATQDRQYKTIVSFDTSAIPPGATLQSATLRLRRGAPRGSDPFTSGFGQCLVDVMSGGFSGSTALQAADFQAVATATAAAAMSAPATNGDWSEGTLDASGLAAINPSGTTQLRVSFVLDDNDDGGDDYMGYYSAEDASSTNHPQLVVTYLP